jgi:DNA-binding CsgD family transcriptional regulator
MAGVLKFALDVVERFDAAKTPAAAGRAFFEALGPLGVRGLGVRAYDAAGGSLTAEAAPGAFAQILPRTWRGSASAKFVESLDPLPKAARRLRRAAFLWSDASPRHDPVWRKYWDALDEHGIGDGTAVHLFTPGGITSRVTVAFDHDALPRRERKAVELASFALIDRMLAFVPARKWGGPLLSERERDCLAFVAEGKSDAEVAEQLGIAETTAHFYIEKAKRKLGVKTRAHAVARLIAAGLL